MVRLSGRLSTLKVTHAREPGMLADGDGLYLQVSRANARSWIFRYHRNGKPHEMGLGSLKAVGLAAARLKAAECRGMLADGIDPIAARDGERAQRAVEDARAITFDHCADAQKHQAWRFRKAGVREQARRGVPLGNRGCLSWDRTRSGRCFRHARPRGNGRHELDLPGAHRCTEGYGPRHASARHGGDSDGHFRQSGADRISRYDPSLGEGVRRISLMR